MVFIGNTLNASIFSELTGLFNPDISVCLLLGKPIEIGELAFMPPQFGQTKSFTQGAML
jgi:hypothetical protein